MAVHRNENLYRNAFLAGCVGFITYGWDAGVLGGILLTDAFQSAMGYPSKNSTVIVPMIIATFLLTSWLGCVIISCFGMMIGRRMWLINGSLIQIAGTIISATSFSYGQLIAGRVLIGIGNGFVSSVGPIYVAEMAVKTSTRGPSVNAMLAAASSGTALAYWVDFGMVFTNGQVVWRFPVALQILWSLITIAFLYPNPDTPRWYYARGRTAEGDSVLERLHSQPLAEPAVQQVKLDILASLELERAGAVRLRVKDFFWDTSDMQSARRIRTGVILIGIAYLMGINMIFYYMTTIFQVYIGLPALTASGCSGLATTILAITNFFGAFWMEKLPRRTWLIVGAVSQTVFLAAFTGLLSTPSYATDAAAAAMLFGWIVVFSPSWAGVTYAYAAEIMPLRYRHIGFPLSISSQWLMAFLTVFAGPIAIADPNVGWKTWIWFLVFNAIGGPFVYFCCPETRGHSLEEIDLIFMSEKLHETDAAKTLEHHTPLPASGHATGNEKGSSGVASEKSGSLAEKGSIVKEGVAL